MERDKWRMRQWFKRYGTQILSCLILIAIIPLLSISCTITIYSRLTMLKQVKGFNETYLKQVITSVDLILKQTSDSCKQMAIDESFSDFENFYKGQYYEKLIETMDIQKDFKQVQSYIDAKSKVQLRMNALKLSNEFVDSVYLLDSRKAIVYTDKGTQYKKEGFRDQAWLTYADREFISPEIMPTRTVGEDMKKPILTILIRSYYVPTNLIAVNLDVEKLIKKVEGVKGNSQDLLGIFTYEGEVILGSSYDDEVMGFMKQYEEATSKEAICTYKGESYMYKSMESPYTGWRFMSLTHLEEYMEPITFMLWGTLIISSIGFVIAVIGANLLSYKLYAPIKRLMSYVEKDRNTPHKDTEFERIYTVFEEMSEEQNELKEKLVQSLPAYREKFLLSLLRRNPYTVDEVIQQLDALDISINRHAYMLVILSVQMEELISSVEALTMKKVVIHKMLQECLESIQYQVVEVENDKWVVILNTESESSIFNKLELFEEMLRGTLGLESILAVGEVQGDIGQIAIAYDEINRFFKYLRINDKKGVNGILEYQDNRKAQVIYPKEKIELLMGYLRNGDLESTQKVFEEIWDETIAGKMMSIRQVQLIYFEVLSGVLQTITLLNLDMEELFGKKRDLYQELIECKNMDYAKSWFKELFKQVSQCINSKIIAYQNKHIQFVIERLGKDCGVQVSLDTLSDELGLNPNYMSRIFKEVTGEKFIDFLTKVRMEKSTQLLKEGDKKIKDIAYEVGYPNSNYFIKIFKEIKGMTPGEYRKLNE